MNYKHRKTGRVVKPSLLDGYHTITGGEVIPSWCIEGSEDWEELKPLFTTDDGVDLYDAQTMLYAYNVKSGAVSNTTYRSSLVYGQPPDRYGWKYFSTKEARVVFITDNEPVLTFEEIINILTNWGMKAGSWADRLLQATREKLKKDDSNL